MNIKLKKKIIDLLCFCRMDLLFRAINKNKLLIVTYHGVYEELDDNVDLFTHLHVDVFRKHLGFIESNYNVISLSDLINHLVENRALPKKSVLITFDDGFRNNYEIAYPVLRELNFPAVIFLTTDFIGSERLLWFDELFLILRQLIRGGFVLNDVFSKFGVSVPSVTLETAYTIISSQFKKMPNPERIKGIAELNRLVNISADPIYDHFKLLSWEQVQQMKSSGLIEFGVHTANHRILSSLSDDEFESELIASKGRMEEKLNCEVTSFCYPNGIRDVDFFDFHEKYLSAGGYHCAFSTEEELNRTDCNRYRLGRLSIGSDITSNLNFLKLNASGFLSLFR